MRVQTERRLYALPAGAASVAVPFTVSNTTTAAVSLGRCGASAFAELDRYQDGGWVRIASALCPAMVDETPLVVAPGATAAGVVQVAGASGMYRIRVPVTEPQSAAPRAVSPSFEARWTDG